MAVCWSGPSSLSSSTCWRYCPSGTNRSLTSQKVQSDFRQSTIIPDVQVFLKRRVGFSDFSVFWVSSCGLLRFDNPVHSGELQQFGFCFILGDYWSQMKCWLIVLSVNKSQMAAVGCSWNMTIYLFKLISGDYFWGVFAAPRDRKSGCELSWNTAHKLDFKQHICQTGLFLYGWSNRLITLKIKLLIVFDCLVWKMPITISWALKKNEEFTVIWKKSLREFRPFQNLHHVSVPLLLVSCIFDHSGSPGVEYY